MRRKSKNILAILLAASMMTGLCSMPVAAAEEIFTEEQTADFDAQEVTVEEEDESVSDDLVVEEPETEVPTEEETDEIDISEEDADQEEVPAEEEAFDSDVAVFSDGEIQPQGALTESGSVCIDGEVLSGSASYDEDTKTLTLDNLQTEGRLVIDEDGPHTIKAIGNNEIGGIAAYCSDLTIIGESKAVLNVNGEIIECSGNLAIDGIELCATADEHSMQKEIQVEGNLTINNANVSVTARGCCISDAEPSANLLMLREAEAQKTFTVTNSTLTLESSDSSNSIEVNKPIIFQNSTIDLTGGIMAGEDTEGYGYADPYKDLTVEKSKLTISAFTDPYYDGNYGIYGIQADTVQITNSDAEVTGAKFTTAVFGNRGVQILNSKFKAEGRGQSIDCGGNVEIGGSIVFADAYVNYGENFVCISAFEVADNNPAIAKDISVTDSWVYSQGIDGNQKINNSVLFIQNNGSVYGKAVVPASVDVRRDHILNVAEPATLTVPSGIKLTNNGTINAYCTSIKGTVNGTAPVITHGKLTGWLKDKKSHWKECSRCKAKFNKAAHSFANWKTTEKEGLGKSGSRQRTCTVCKYVQKETIPAIQVMSLRLAGGDKTVNLRWSKVSGADGYMIYGAKCGRKYKYAFKKTVGKNTVSWSDRRLEPGKYYKYYVVAYKMVNGKKKVIGESGDMHTATLGRGYGYTNRIIVQNSALCVKAGKAARIRAAATNTNNNIINHIAPVRYVSTNVRVATVDGRGRVTARAKGSCYVCCYGMNGLMKRVKVTVK